MIGDPTRRSVIGGLGLGAARLMLGPADAATSPDTTPATGHTLGVLFPRSGPQTLDGDEAWRGVVLAVEAARQNSKTPIRLIRGDADTPADAIKTMVKAAGTPGAITAILGTQSSTASFAATAAAELANIPYVELDAPADAITARGFRGLLRTGTTTSEFAATAVSAITGIIAPGWHSASGKLRIALLFDVGASNGAFAAAMLAACNAVQLPVILTVGYATNAMGLSAEVERMRRAKIDLLVHAGRAEHVLLLYTAMTIARWRPHMIIGAGAGYGLSEIGFELGKALDNTMVVSNPLYGPGASDIAARYQRRFATPPRSAASLTSHVGTTLVIEALNGDKPLPQTLAAIKRDRGALANGWGVDFSTSGQNRRSFATLQQWRQGRLITIDPTIAGAGKPTLAL